MHCPVQQSLGVDISPAPYPDDTILCINNVKQLIRIVGH
jgi:hypothetical protein